MIAVTSTFRMRLICCTPRTLNGPVGSRRNPDVDVLYEEYYAVLRRRTPG